MTDWRVLILSALSLLILLAGLIALALPDSYEGNILYAFDDEHSVRRLDLIGLALVAVGGVVAWGGGLLWWRRTR
jgi:hypothetical protein